MNAMNETEFASLARNLSWILCDVDGVLTDGNLYYGSHGQTIRFNVKDGLGLKLARRAGLRVGVLSGRNSIALQRRAEELSLDAVIVGRSDKGPAFDEFLDHHSVTAGSVAFIGDDLPDRVVMNRCALSFCPSDAVEEVRHIADRILDSAGGMGAAREMVELLLRARGDWEDALSQFPTDG